MTKNKAHECGFTLFEVLVAVSILSVGLLAVLQAGRSAQSETAWATRADEASLLAVTKAVAPGKKAFQSMTDASGDVLAQAAFSWRRRMDDIRGVKGLEECRRGRFTVSWDEDEIAVERVSCGQ